MRKVNHTQKPPTLAWRRGQTFVSVWLITATTTAYFAAPPIPSAVAQQNTRSLTVKQPINRNLVWDAILRSFKRKVRPLGSRGDFCAIAPGQLEEINLIWSDRPLFLWQGTVQRLEIRHYSLENSYSSQEVLWSQPVTTANQSATYTGKTLLPGQSYDWELVVDPNSARNPRFTFQVMEKDKRDLMAAELKALEAQLKSGGATTEEIALQRANYFAERDLWSDALQEIYSVKNPSAALTITAQEISAYSCGA